MDRPQSQPVFLTFVSAPAASLITSSALTTGDIVGFSSNIPSLTAPPQAGLGRLRAHPCAGLVPNTHLVPQVTSWPLFPIGDQQWQHREGPAGRNPAPEPTTPASAQRLAGHQRRAVQVSRCGFGFVH